MFNELEDYLYSDGFDVERAVIETAVKETRMFKELSDIEIAEVFLKFLGCERFEGEPDIDLAEIGRLVKGAL